MCQLWALHVVTILMQFCDQKHNALPYIVKQDRTGQDKDHKNSSGDEIANVNFLTTISHTRRPTSKYRKKRQTYFV